MIALEVNDLSIEAGGKTLLEGLSFVAAAGEKIGVVGRNGAGKTTLLTVLGGDAPPLAGTVRRSGAVGYLHQEPRLKGEEVEHAGIEHILAGRGLIDVAARLEKARLALEESYADENVQRFSDLEQRYGDLGGYNADAEIASIADGLGLPDEKLLLPVRALSGGERRRLELARILFAGSDLLLLDEPTNHLDAAGRDWLMRFLGSYRGALVVVSHDLQLLDASITRILHLDRDSAVQYTGTYSRYKESRRQDEHRVAGIASRQELEIRRLKVLADSMRGQTEKRARKAKTLDTRRERLERDKISAPKKERKVRYRFPEPPHCGRMVMEARGLAKSYGGPEIFESVNIDVGRGDRLLVMGLNGAGKTSLLRILADRSAVDAGSFRLGTGVELGYYAQEHEDIRDGVSVLDHMREAAPLDERALRGLLGMFDLSGEIAFQDAGTLSGGEKTKLALAQLVAGRQNFLLLDEPTNNLDPPSRTAIAHALAAWPGTMVLVSHDPEFVEALQPGRVLFMPDGSNEGWDDDLLDLVELA
jgi:ATPase subunit of ABC transporter with duplicated ATPase domains